MKEYRFRGRGLYVRGERGREGGNKTDLTGEIVRAVLYVHVCVC